MYVYPFLHPRHGSPCMFLLFLSFFSCLLAQRAGYEERKIATAYARVSKKSSHKISYRNSSHLLRVSRTRDKLLTKRVQSAHIRIRATAIAFIHGRYSKKEKKSLNLFFP